MPKTKMRIKEKKRKKELIKARLMGEIISSNSKKAVDLYGKSRFGELKKGKIIYSFPEVLYLVDEKKIEIFDSGKKLSFDRLAGKLKDIDKKIMIKYIVFKDLRNKGYIIKTALKFGAEFRVYDKGKKIGEEHARWILYPVSENSELSWQDFSARNRVAHSTKKSLLIAVVDSENDVSYYEVKWLRP